jgi:Leucine-rich repeat (LRR) protein
VGQGLSWAFAVAMLLVSCSGNHTYGTDPSPVDTQPLDPGDSAAVTAILRANDLPDTVMRHILSIKDTRVVALKLIHTDVTYEYLPVDAVSKIPSNISALTAIETLMVQNQAVSSLPKSLFELPSLRVFGVHDCPLAKIDIDIGSCSTLVVLSVSACPIESLPNSLCDLTDLRYLALTDNQLGSLPECIGQISGLHELYLQRNRLCSLPASITNLRSIKRLGSGDYTLDLSSNYLTNLEPAVASWADEFDRDWHSKQQVPPDSLCH